MFRDSYVVLSDNGQVIVCWHPEVPFPYEHTKVSLLTVYLNAYDIILLYLAKVMFLYLCNI